MRKWPLGKKALVLVLLLGTLDIFQGAFSLVNLYRTRATVQSLNDRTYAALYWAGKLKGAAKDQRIAIIFYLNSSSVEEMDKYEALVSSTEAEMKSIRENYPLFDEQDRASIITSAQAQARFFQAWLHIRDLVRAGKKQEAWHVYNNELMDATLARRKMEDYLADLGQQRGTRLSHDAIEEVSWGVPVVWTILSFAILLGTGSFLFFATSVRRSGQQLQEYAERLALATRAAGLGVWEHDLATDRFIMDEQFRRIHGIAPGAPDLNFATWIEFVHPDDRPRIREEIETLSREKALSEYQYRILRVDGEVRHIHSFALAQRDAGGRLVRFIGTDLDTTEQKLAEIKLQKSEDRYRTAFQTAQDSVNINRLSDGQYIECNEAFLNIMGFTREEVVGHSSVDLHIWANIEDRNRMIESLRRTSACRSLEAQFRKKNGELFWGVMSASPIEVDGVPCILSVTRDVTEAKAAEEQIRNLGFYDPLTGLPNRRLLIDRLHQALAAATRSERKGALLFIDVDNFKMLNDTLGHRTGDLLLEEVARRLIASVRDSDTVARLGGDEFVVILGDLSNSLEEAATQSKIAATKILAAASRTYQLAGREYHSTASIGITILENQEESIDEVLQQADIAMYEAKAAGRNTMRFFAPELQSAINSRAAVEDELRTAIQTRQFVLYYQPQVTEGRLSGVEALIRWNHPVRGLLAAGAFIPLAEETWQILPMGDWVLETACLQIAEWSKRPDTAAIPVSVNISARQLLQPDFVEKVMRVLDATQANPASLVLEITESVLLDNTDEIIAKMTALRSHGLKFSFDDFGTGYSSFSYLKRLPLDQLKIDRTFVRDMLVDVTSGAIAQAIISLGKAMGISVVAEGVETEEQRAYLARLGCTAFQGFLYSPALPVSEFEKWRVDFAGN